MPPTNTGATSPVVVTEQATTGEVRPKLQRQRSTESRQMVESILKPLELTNNEYRKIMNMMTADMEKALDPETHRQADMKCYTSYVRAAPNGSESGVYLAIDLGGTNFRVLLIKLEGDEVLLESKVFLIPQHVQLGPALQLFDHLADCIFKFIVEKNLQDRQLPLGFTFSFPCHQIGLNRAILSEWTKGFKCEGGVGKDVVEMLTDAIHRRGDMTNVHCLAVVNDTIGTLMSCAVHDKKCAIGVILGTGTNACYIESLDKVKNWTGDMNEPKQMLINTEWCAFGNGGCLDFMLTDYDKSVDKHSLNPGRHIFEKLLSGLYLGEVARLVIERLRKHHLLFEGKGSDLMSTRGRFYTKYLSEIEADDLSSFPVTRQILSEMNISTHSEQDYILLRQISILVAQRAAYLAAAGIACLLNKMDRKDVTVGVDGSLYLYHPSFHDMMTSKTKELVNPGINFQLTVASDGSGKGAALVAAVAHRLLKEKVGKDEIDDDDLRKLTLGQ